MDNYIISKTKYSAVIWVLVVLLLAACSKSGQKATVGIPSTEYSEDSAMAHFLVEPDRALVLLDSAVVCGNLTAQRAQYLKAVVLLSGKDEQDSCLSVCQRMVDEKAWEELPDSEDVVSFQVDLYRLMANAAQSLGRNLAVVRYCREGVGLAHGVDKLLGDETDMLSRMGLVLCQMGQQADGMDALHRAEQLAKDDNRWSSLISYLNTLKKMYYAYQSAGQYREAKTTVHEALKRLDDLRTGIGSVENAPQAMACDSAALEEFIQYYQASFHSYLVNLYGYENTPDSVQYWMSRLAENPLSSDPCITQTLIRPLILLGRYDEARQQIDSLKQIMAGDTLNVDYIGLLRLEMLMALHGSDAGNALEQQAEHVFSLSDSVTALNSMHMMADAAVQYQLQDERQRRVDAEDKLLLSIIALVSALCVIIGAASYMTIRRLRRRSNALNEELEKTKEELDDMIEKQEIEDMKPSEVPLEDIYSEAQRVMSEQEPYRNPSFDIAALATLVQSNRLYVSSAINSLGGTNFRSWLAKYRVEHAKKVLLQNPSIKNDQLADECGFDNRVSLYRKFKETEGMSPSEWIKRELKLLAAAKM